MLERLESTNCAPQCKMIEKYHDRSFSLQVFNSCTVNRARTDILPYRDYNTISTHQSSPISTKIPPPTNSPPPLLNIPIIIKNRHIERTTTILYLEPTLYIPPKPKPKPKPRSTQNIKPTRPLIDSATPTTYPLAFLFSGPEVLSFLS
jgi:hypothetical protein